MKLLPTRLFLLLLACGIAAAKGAAAEVTTNGTGGGRWTEPASWRGKQIPGPDDTVVIRKGDAIGFDRNDDGKTTCRKLSIDPGGEFHFEPLGGKMIFVVPGGIDSFGPIRMDGSKADTDYLELRLSGDTADKRIIHLNKGAGLVVAGRAGLPDNKKNVAIVSSALASKKVEFPARIALGAQTMIDVQKAELRNVSITVNNVDNTGNRPNERCNIMDNRFLGHCHVECANCDTPVISHNTFDLGDVKLPAGEAIQFTASPLAEAKGNIIRGHTTGIHVTKATDTVLSENTFERCAKGIDILHGNGVVIKQNNFKNCETAVAVHGANMTGIEENRIEGAKVGLHLSLGSAQISSLQVHKLVKGGLAIVNHGNCNLSLLNCNLEAAQVKLENPGKKIVAKGRKRSGPAQITAWQFAVFKVTGAPENSQVVVREIDSDVPADVADPCVRGCPAIVLDGLSPLPSTGRAIVLRSWSIDAGGDVDPAPEYEWKVLSPIAGKDGTQRKVLASGKIQPAITWVRPKSDDPKPTVEVKIP